MGRLAKIYRFLIYILPAVLFFSYYPVISLGGNSSMNFELSLPLIWLAVFDLLAFVILVRKKLISGILKKWQWLLLPIFMTVSLVWSLNALRGILTVGIVWLVYFAIYAFWSLRSLFSEFGFKEKFLKVFFASSLVICVWCFLQCILDLAGVSREVSLLCAGCTYKMFGFSHPNGFAIEPQFMGNLLLAPAIVSGWLLNKEILITACPSDTLRAAQAKSSRSAAHIVIKISLFFIFVATLFLTFSRGAIYAFIVAMIFMTVMQIVRTKKWKVLILWPVILLAFLFTLNLQGIMAEISPTKDNYIDGVAKSLNQLSLGIIDVRGGDKVNDGKNADETDALLSEKSDVAEEESVFDGYVEESTDTRVRLTNSAIEIWQKDFTTMLFGTGLGSAGQALYVNGLSLAPKEIVQNQYASLLLEIGLVGIVLVIFTMILVLRVVIKSSAMPVVLTLIVGYGVTLFFFSGLPNALHIYLLPALFYVIL